MKEFFVISDIHGMYKPFTELLQHWDPNTQQLVILGDMIDRGPQSLEVLRKVMDLKQSHEYVDVLMGNHDEMLLDFIRDPNGYGFIYQNYNGGKETVESFLKDPRAITKPVNHIASLIENNFQNEITFLQQLPRYMSVGNVLFTHAGFNSLAPHWKMTTDNEFVWIRDHFKHPNRSGYINVFGHTPTCNIHPVGVDEPYGIFKSSCGTYIGIDGACAYGGQLNGLVINRDGDIVRTFSAKMNKND